MDYRHFFTLLLAAIPMVSTAQIEMKDSISVGQTARDSIRPGTAENPYDQPSNLSRPVDYRMAYNPAANPLFPYRLSRPVDLQIPDFHFTPGISRLFSWRSGAIVASGGARSFPGMMQIDSGTFGIYQSAGDFTFYAGGMANKYGYFRGLHTQYGLNGSITYRFTPRLSATVFGDYYFGQPPRMANGMPMPPSMLGYYGRSTFGGYVDYHINEHWGVQTGVQTVQQVGTNRYRAEPIVTPYYKINKKVAIGLPVGQILYHVLRK